MRIVWDQDWPSSGIFGKSNIIKCFSAICPLLSPTYIKKFANWSSDRILWQRQPDISPTVFSRKQLEDVWRCFAKMTWMSENLHGQSFTVFFCVNHILEWIPMDSHVDWVIVTLQVVMKCCWFIPANKTIHWFIVICYCIMVN